MVLGFLLSASAFASGTYRCDIDVLKDGSSIGKIQLEKQFGMLAGRLYTIEVSKKKNILGKTVEEVDVVLDGLLQSGDGAQDSSLEGNISVVKRTIKRTISTETTSIIDINGVGDFSVEASIPEYTVSGACFYKHSK